MTTRHYTLEELQKRKEQTTQRIAAYEQRMKRIGFETVVDRGDYKA